MVKKFLRRTSNRYSKLGLRRKNKQKWRRPSGRDNKMREKRRGYPAVIEVGYKNEKSVRGKLKEKIPVTIMNLKDLEKVGKDQIAVIGNIGIKKKLEIAKFAKEKKIEIYNMNVGKYLKLNKKKNVEKPERKKEEKKEDKKEESKEIKEKREKKK